MDDEMQWRMKQALNGALYVIMDEFMPYVVVYNGGCTVHLWDFTDWRELDVRTFGHEYPNTEAGNAALLAEAKVHASLWFAEIEGDWKE